MKWFATAALVAACLLIVAVDSPWGDMQNHAHWDKPFRWIPPTASDVVLNAMLGMPIGLATPRLFRRGILSAALIAAPVSVAAEWTQIYSHSRFPSFSDVALNVLGAIAAAMIATAWKVRDDAGR